ncbi:MAG: hypothetical protein ACI32C_05855 [Candidatus Enteromonas sp.]
MISNHGLTSVITAKSTISPFGGGGGGFWYAIKESIDNGLPATMCTGFACGDGAFANHYTNIYGYETWVGIPINGGEQITKKYLKAMLNFGYGTGYYCDADILNCAQIGLTTYRVNYKNLYSFRASDFAEEFINDAGGGQYFFYPVAEPVSLSNYKTLQTERLRASYIENQYLVLSPNRENAGEAYIDITFPHKVPNLSFSAALWSGSEGIRTETFRIQYYDGAWKNHLSIDLTKLPILKDYPDEFHLLLPKNTNRIRFSAVHPNPTGDRNKGRVCLDDFHVEYN